MKIIVLADGYVKQEFKKKQINANIQVTYIENLLEIPDSYADTFFLLTEEINWKDHKIFEGKPVFINSTICTLKELDLPENFNRVNSWLTFINREVWEIATCKEDVVKEIFKKLEWEYIKVADEPGLVSARIISMIVNEAFFALGEGVSTKGEIDVAMKLGTNYPYGPFEWSDKIGLEKVHHLLEKLSKTDSRYSVAPAMKKQLFNW